MPGDADRRWSRLVVGQHHRGHARDEEHEEPDQDEVVRRVGQRTRIAALADVQADIPDETEQRTDQCRGEHQDLERYPRRAVERPAQPFGEVVQPGYPALTVLVSDPQKDNGNDRRRDRHTDHLVQCGTATLARRRKNRHGVRCYSLPSVSDTPSPNLGTCRHGAHTYPRLASVDDRPRMFRRGQWVQPS